MRIVQSNSTPRESPTVDRTPAGEPGVFDDLLEKVTENVVHPQQEAASAVEAFNRGTQGRLHETLLAVDKAEISLKLLVGVRNRLLESYREIMRMGS